MSTCTLSVKDIRKALANMGSYTHLSVRSHVACGALSNGARNLGEIQFYNHGSDKRPSGCLKLDVDVWYGGRKDGFFATMDPDAVRDLLKLLRPTDRIWFRIETNVGPCDERFNLNVNRVVAVVERNEKHLAEIPVGLDYEKRGEWAPVAVEAQS